MDFWTVVFAHLIPQTDRTPDHQIPLVAPLDHRLFINQTVGYRFENMPQDREAYRMGLEAINKEAEQRYGAVFSPCLTRCRRWCLKQFTTVSRKPPRIFGTPCLCTAFGS